MTISSKTQKILWGRSANRCAICHCELVENSTEEDDESIVGDVCHIVARECKGPRGLPSLTPTERDNYNNLILLCKVHHKIVDDQPNEYTIGHLKKIKQAHEDWVRQSLETFDPDKQQDDEVYVDYIEEWADLAEIDTWNIWSSWVFAFEPLILTDRMQKLEELHKWLTSRAWPGRYAELESSFENFRRVLDDFTGTFCFYGEEVNGEQWKITYRVIPGWNPSLYWYLDRKFHFAANLVQDLTLELTRAANYMCDTVRATVLPTYRIKEGKSTVEKHGKVVCPEYRNDERNQHPYPGLEKFKAGRVNRDDHCGEGYEPKRED